MRYIPFARDPCVVSEIGIVSMQQSGVYMTWFLRVISAVVFAGLVFQVGWQWDGCDVIDTMRDPDPVARNESRTGISNVQRIMCWKAWRTRVNHSLERMGNGRDGNDTSHPSVTIFAAPTPPFTRIQHSRLHRAIASWLMLGPTVRVVLLSTSQSVHAVCQKFKERSGGNPPVVCESDVDTTFDGVPLLNSVLDRARAAESEIAVFVDPAELILLPSLFSASLKRAQLLSGDWLLASPSWRTENLTSLGLPAKEEEYSAHPFPLFSSLADEDVRSCLRATGALFQRCEGIGVLAWNTGTTPLLSGVTPPFFMGFRGYEGWVLSEAINSKIRRVVDGSDVITAIVEQDDAERPQETNKDSLSFCGGMLNSNLTSSGNAKPVELQLATGTSRWEEDVNMYWTVAYGRYFTSQRTLEDAPLQMKRCRTSRRSESSRVCVVHKRKKGSLQCDMYCRQVRRRCDQGSECSSQEGAGSLAPNGPMVQGDSSVELDQMKAGRKDYRAHRLFIASVSVFTAKASKRKGGFQNRDSGWYSACDCQQFAGMCPLPALPHPSTVLRRVSMPHDMQTLARGAAAGPDKLLVLTVAALNYAEFLFAWVCRMEALRLRNYIIGALDDELYRVGVLHGLPIFRVGEAELDAGVSVPVTAINPDDNANMSWLERGTTLDRLTEQPNQCYFGTECFTRLTKYKSRVVLHLLRQGYNVLFSDVDVYWFQNPIGKMWSYGPGHLVVQSDNYNETGPANDIRRVNSGFYLARNDTGTVTAFQHIIVHALASKGSEQPSFYANLCGSTGEYRVGDDLCRPPLFGNLTVAFLDRSRFPNGASYGIWDADDPKSVCEQKGCFVLHNNWVSGRELKLERQVQKDLMAFDMSKRSCKWSWRNEKTERSY
ncbi:hypothetical protein CBR_g25868 [Chara braunii]|uniref:Nucleotide-diphospho-sugar transferase domain-containing protein n=1 Tax=Chara braunii TaxID=69332 RepID=A0A388L6L3_CHABU|nr:hypothetical protein CBR_g25868 [Chara braunii]|eukprot:GBG77937.1 hypothetical protein CBR_g25868 [Chara braunii]